ATDFSPITVFWSCGAPYRATSRRLGKILLGAFACVGAEAGAFAFAPALGCAATKLPVARSTARCEGGCGRVERSGGDAARAEMPPTSEPNSGRAHASGVTGLIGVINTTARESCETRRWDNRRVSSRGNFAAVMVAVLLGLGAAWNGGNVGP